MQSDWIYSPPSITTGFDVDLVAAEPTRSVHFLTFAIFLVAISGPGPNRTRISLVSLLISVSITASLAVGSLLFAGFSLHDIPEKPIIWLAFAVAIIAGIVVHKGLLLRRTVYISSIACVLCLLCALLSVNQWTGYYPTLKRAALGLSGSALPNQADLKTVLLKRSDLAHENHGFIVPIHTPEKNSGFRARTEYVFLPPAWFKGSSTPVLPAVIMIGGLFTSPSDWILSGDALRASESYAHAHGGFAPILVFADPSGKFIDDTECVDGPRGKAETHLVRDLRDYVNETFSSSRAPGGWGVVGYSMGGTCAVNMVTRNSSRISTFVSISGEARPNLGASFQDPVADLFGGNETAANSYDPEKVMLSHGRYSGVSGWFLAEGSESGGELRSEQISTARHLANVARNSAIDVSETYLEGDHTWAFARMCFGLTLDGLSDRLYSNIATSLTTSN